MPLAVLSLICTIKFIPAATPGSSEMINLGFRGRETGEEKRERGEREREIPFPKSEVERD